MGCCNGKLYVPTFAKPWYPDIWSNRSRCHCEDLDEIKVWVTQPYFIIWKHYKKKRWLREERTLSPGCHQPGAVTPVFPRVSSQLAWSTDFRLAGWDSLIPNPTSSLPLFLSLPLLLSQFHRPPLVLFLWRTPI